MSAFKSVGHLMATLTSMGAGISKHKAARAVRFVYRHPGVPGSKHRRIIRALNAAHARRVVRRAEQRVAGTLLPNARYCLPRFTGTSTRRRNRAAAE